LVVVAIIGILAAVALPAYQKYVANAEVAKSQGTMASYITEVESQVLANPGVKPELDIPNTGTISYVDTFADNGSGTIVASLKNALLGAAPTITMTRAVDGAWACSTNITDTDFKPSGC
jgi:type IV pilus assembly protein PilA